ncbi:MAG: hypothetical protein KDA61_21755, partial [Planctomycetales bacterium]|nr:hypothetical protein [Planctomycetales bacterium]
HDMFQLDESLRQWRSDLARYDSLRTVDLDELEAHLRDGIEADLARGLSEEEAFILASRRLGKPAELHREFDVGDAGVARRRRMFWMMWGYAFFAVVSSLLQTFANCAQATASYVSGDGATMGAAGATTLAAGWLVVWWAIWHASRHNSGAIFQGWLEGWTTREVLAAFAVIAPVALLAYAGSSIAMATWTPVEQLGRASLAMAWVRLAFAYMVPLALALMATHGRRLETASEGVALR